MKKITKSDVAAYKLGCVADPAFREAIEQAREVDPVVRRWFQQWETEGDDDVHEAFRTPAAELAERFVEEQTQIAAVADFFDAKTVARDALASAIPADRMLCGGPRLAYRAEVPLTNTFDHRPPAMTAIEIPCIQPDFANDRLTIRQWATDTPVGGVLLIVAAKIKAPGQVERFGPVRVHLEKGQRLDGTDYWYQEVPISSLIPNWEAHDHVVFYAESADGADRNNEDGK